MASHQYWMFDWLEEYGDVGHEKIRELLLNDKNALVKLKDQATSAESAIWTPPKSGNNIVAGVGIDLTGNLACRHPECRSHQVDELFSRAWHYFDKIIVADSVSHMLATHWEIDEPDHWTLLVAEQLEVLNYIRNIGAADLVHFAKKAPTSIEYWNQRYQSDVAGQAIRISGDYRRSLLKEADIKFSEHREESAIWHVNHPSLEHVQIVTTPDPNHVDDVPDRQQVVDAVIARQAGYLLSDVAMSRRASSPLGSTNELHKILLAGNENVDHGSVAFNLHLPFLEGISIVDLLKLRNDNQDAFDDFRQSLTIAIQNQIDNSDSGDPKVIAEEVENDVIAPQIRTLNRQMSAAAENLKRKTWVTLGVGALATTVGLIGGLGQAAFLAVAAGAILDSSPAMSYLDKKEQIELHNMYFLWKASHAKRDEYETE